MKVERDTMVRHMLRDVEQELQTKCRTTHRNTWNGEAKPLARNLRELGKARSILKDEANSRGSLPSQSSKGELST